MSTVVTFRADSVLEKALEDLMTDGRDRTRVIRDAVLAAAQAKSAQRLMREAERLASDDEDVAESQRVLAEMDSLRAR